MRFIPFLPLPRSWIAESSDTVAVPLTSCRNADATVIGAAAAGNFSIEGGGYGSGTLLLKGEEAISETETSYFMFEIAVPHEYISTANMWVNVTAIVAGAGTLGATKTIDMKIYENIGDGTASADLCATAAQTLTTSSATYIFGMTEAAVLVSDRLSCFVETSIIESVGTAIYVNVTDISFGYQGKG